MASRSRAARCRRERTAVPTFPVAPMTAMRMVLLLGLLVVGSERVLIRTGLLSKLMVQLKETYSRKGARRLYQGHSGRYP
ncbi:hypothetical protein MN0502_29670 [Arthrobacter sp. MN05-02]|nr:hypothetical protein MN0502_29670 [Arthrobacter sp. MN05-02]